MSEKRPEKRIENPRYFKCDRCEKKVATTYENTAYFVFEKNQWFNHVRTVCEDGFFTAMPIDPGNIDHLQFANQFMKVEYEFIEDLNTDDKNLGDEMRQMINEFYGIKEPQVREVTPGQDERIRRFGEVITNMPDKDIHEEFELPMPPKKLPERWDGEE